MSADAKQGKLLTAEERSDRIVKTVRALRLRKKWSYETLGKKSGISPFTIIHWERSVASPSIITLMKVLEVFGLQLVIAPMKEKGARTHSEKEELTCRQG